MAIGIYALYWQDIDKVYIGQSINMENRFTQHIYSLKTNKASNKMLECYNKYGTPSFQILCTCSILDLDRLENFWIDEFDSINLGLNTVSGGIGGMSFLSPQTKFSQEAIEKSFFLLLDSSNTSRYISKITGVSIGVINSISALSSHAWLEEKYPKEYSILKNLKNSRRKSCQKTKYSSTNIMSPYGIIYNMGSDSIKSFAKRFELNACSFSKIFTGARKQYKGWILWPHPQK